MKWTLLDNQEMVAQVACERVLAAACKAISERGTFRIVLAGGNTPERCYRRLSSSASDWEHWYVYFGDERCLPEDDPRRNSRMAAGTLTGKVPIPVGQIHPIPVELGAEAAVRHYTRIVNDAMPFDLALMGVGEDGHTASLFPGHHHNEGLSVVPVYHAPKPPAERVSLGPAAFRACRQLLFLATGSGKRQPLVSWRDGNDLPAARIAVASRSEILVDRAAWGCQDSSRNPRGTPKSEH
ncbi:MAG: 6-phosphogluconolactonase [Gammaproteobacteria bacterium]|nr:6-phosphogluconolactonase [Gammaproteobacteria bacterium]